MNRGMRDLLTYIVEHYANEDNERRIDLDANAPQSGTDLEADKAAAADREWETAEDLGDAFERGLELAWERAREGENRVTLDDRDPEQDAMASALISYLVRFGLAESESHDLGEQHYAYDISVNWDRLRNVAADSGQRLDDLFEATSGAV